MPTAARNPRETSSAGVPGVSPRGGQDYFVDKHAELLLVYSLLLASGVSPGEHEAKCLWVRMFALRACMQPQNAEDAFNMLLQAPFGSNSWRPQIQKCEIGEN